MSIETPSEVAIPKALQPKFDIQSKDPTQTLRVGPGIIVGGPLPAKYEDFVDRYKEAFAYLDTSSNLRPMQISTIRGKVMDTLLKELARMTYILNDKNHYDQRLKDPDPIKGGLAGLVQIAQAPNNPADMYANVLKSKLSTNERVICKDFAELSRDVLKTLGFKSATAIINTGIEHMFTMAQDPKTGMMYIITADGAGGMGGKVFQAKNEQALREIYQAHLLTTGVGRVGNSFGGAIFDANGKFTGYAQTAWEKANEAMVRGGNMPSDMLNISQQGVSNVVGNAGLVAFATNKGTYIDSHGMEKGHVKEGEILGWEAFTSFVQSAIDVPKPGTEINLTKATRISNVVIGGKIQSKDMQIADGFSARVFMAGNADISTGVDRNDKFMAPDMQASGLIGGHLEYKSGKWSFTTDAGKSYELLNPSQYYPGFKLLPSGEFLMTTAKYKGEGYDVFAKIQADHKFNRESAGLTVGATISDVTLSGSFLTGKEKTGFGNTLATKSASFSASTKLGNGVSAGVSNTDNFFENKAQEIYITAGQDLLSLLESKNEDKEAMQKLCNKLGITLKPEDTQGPDWLQVLSVKLYIANKETLGKNRKLQEYIASLGIQIEGGVVSVQKGSTLYNSLSFRASLGMDTINGGGGVVSTKGEYQLDRKTTITATASVDYISAIGRLTIDRAMMTTDEGTVVHGTVSAVGGTQFGKVVAGMEAGIKTVMRDGTGSDRALGIGTNGLSFRFGETTLMFGGNNQSTTLSLGGIRNESIQNPGVASVDDKGFVLANYADMYQSLSKDKEDKPVVESIITKLGEIGQRHILTLSKDFTKELKSKSALRAFDQYLTNNAEILKNTKVKSLHFESMTDWLGAFRNTQGTSYDSDTGHLFVRAIEKDQKALDTSIFTEKKSPSAHEKSAEDLMKTYNVTIKSDRPVTVEELNGIEGLFLMAERKGETDRMKNITINLLSDDDGFSGDQMHRRRGNQVINMDWNERDRILTVPLSRMTFQLPSEKTQGPGVQELGEGGHMMLQKFLTQNNIKNINDVVVIQENDKKNFLTTDGEKTFDFVKNINGKTYVHKEGLDTLMILLNKSATPDGLGFREKMILSDMTSAWKKSSIYVLDQFDSYLDGKMSDAKKDIARVGVDAGGGTLYEFIKTKEIEISANGDKSVTFTQQQANTRQAIGTVDIKMDKAGDTEIVLKSSQSDITYNFNEGVLADDVWTKMQKDGNEDLHKMLVGIDGTNPNTGKPQKINGILARLYAVKKPE